jgi:hypothetical protein
VRGKNHWNRAEILAAVAVFLTAATILVAVYLPEIRLALHLDKRPVTPTVAAVTPAAPVQTKPELSPQSEQRGQQATPSTVDNNNHSVQKISGSSNVVGNTVNGNGNVVGSNNHIQIVTPPITTDTVSGTVTNAETPEKSSTLRDLFKSDFAKIGGISYNGFDLHTTDGETIHVDRRIILDFPEKNEFIAFYIPSTQHGFEACLALADLIQPMISTLANRIDVTGGDSGGVTDIKDLHFAGRVFLYHEWPLSNKQKADITEAYSAKHLDVQFRGLEYLADARRK